MTPDSHGDSGSGPCLPRSHVGRLAWCFHETSRQTRSILSVCFRSATRPRTQAQGRDHRSGCSPLPGALSRGRAGQTPGGWGGAAFGGQAHLAPWDVPLFSNEACAEIIRLVEIKVILGEIGPPVQDDWCPIQGRSLCEDGARGGQAQGSQQSPWRGPALGLRREGQLCASLWCQAVVCPGLACPPWFLPPSPLATPS